MHMSIKTPYHMAIRGNGFTISELVSCRRCPAPIITGTLAPRHPSLRKERVTKSASVSISDACWSGLDLKSGNDDIDFRNERATSAARHEARKSSTAGGARM